MVTLFLIYFFFRFKFPVREAKLIFALHLTSFRTPGLTLLTPRVSSGKLCAGVGKIWLIGPHSACSFIQPKLLAASSIIYFIAKFLAPSDLELKKRSPWRIFRYTRLLTVVATEKIPLKVHRSETWNLHTLDSW